MAGQQRKCANCRFFSDAGMPGNGWCMHPKRQLNSGVKLLVRAGELACRNSWGGDLFQDRHDEVAGPAAAADLPGNDQDDLVTSVTVPSGRPAPAEDRVVRDRFAAQRIEPVDANDPAQRDQEERARVMARGSRDALAQARQRYSTRRQPLEPDDVVAGDDVPDEGTSDRVVTRQERFSDREFAAGLPPVHTPPVPREEVQSRSASSEDRFDSVPAINPDFDMPGHRTHAAQPQPEVAPVFEFEPEPEPVPESPVQNEVDESQLTAYEHVLQRARRIRATKQERVRPLRHSDVLLARDVPPPGDPETIHESSGQRQDWQAEAIDERPLHIEDDAFTGALSADSDGLDLDPTFSYPDSDQAWDAGDSNEAGASGWDDQDGIWDEDDAPLYDSEPQRPGWLSRLRRGYRSAERSFDDATVSRHVASSDAYLDNEPFEYDDVSQDADSYPAPAVTDDGDSDLPPWRGSFRDSTYAQDLPAAAPIPAPVPASERAGGTVGMPSTPVRPASTLRAPSLAASGLPDLDDVLFDDDEGLEMSSRHTAAWMDEPEPDDDEIRSASPRNSFFRASRYPARETTAAFHDATHSEPFDFEATLPDIEADRLDLRDAIARGSELIDRRIDVAPDIPRQCRTCRSFRSADGGVRGWCTNEWAFTHRRMVNDDDLACDGTIGCWWLPADHLRLDLYDDSDDVRTPRMDDLIAGTKPAARRVAGE